MAIGMIWRIKTMSKEDSFNNELEELYESWSPATEVQGSLTFDAYCKISRVNMEIGVFATQGISDFPALMVTVSPCSFIPETTPIMPAQVTDINL